MYVCTCVCVLCLVRVYIETQSSVTLGLVPPVFFACVGGGVVFSENLFFFTMGLVPPVICTVWPSRLYINLYISMCLCMCVYIYVSVMYTCVCVWCVIWLENAFSLHFALVSLFSCYIHICVCVCVFACL